MFGLVLCTTKSLLLLGDQKDEQTSEKDEIRSTIGSQAALRQEQFGVDTGKSPRQWRHYEK